MKTMKLASLALAMPLLALGASSARQEYTAVLALEPDVARGAGLFEHCASCHGPDGSGAAQSGTPRIAGQYYRVLVRQIIAFRHGKRWDIRMEGIASSHNVMSKLQDIADVAGYASRLERAGVRRTGDGQHLERGPPLYARQCASCHGDEGQGDEQRDIPRIGGQHADYVSRQIYDAVDGRRPLLTQTHRKRFAPLEFADVLGLADYVSRMGGDRPQDSAGETPGPPRTPVP